MTGVGRFGLVKENGMHMGRSWYGTKLEDCCPCPKVPCGLVADFDEACMEHNPMFAKTIRQAHWPADCPGAPKPPEDES